VRRHLVSSYRHRHRLQAIILVRDLTTTQTVSGSETSSSITQRTGVMTPSSASLETIRTAQSPEVRMGAINNLLERIE
jgi:hypothetical protein